MSGRIRILVTSDIHGRVFPESYESGKREAAGLGCANALISSLRDENTLLIDNGDVLQGSPLSTYHYRYRTDDISPVTNVMHEMHYDYVNAGNHDFNYGEDALMMHLQNVGAPCITSNMIYHGKPFGPTYVIREIEGKKIAVFGLITQYIPHWEPPKNIRHFKFNDAFETAEKTVSLLKMLEKPDYIVCVYHGGIERDPATGILVEEETGEDEAYRMMKSIDGIDVLITGHQHKSICGEAFGTHFIQTKDQGKELACVDIYPDEDEIETRILKTGSECDEEILRSAEEEQNACNAWLDETLGTTSVDLSVENEISARRGKCQLVTFINQTMMKAAGTDLASTCLSDGVTGLKPEITLRQLLCTYPFPNTIVVKKITGKILKEYLEKNAEFWTMKDEEITPLKAFDGSVKLHTYDMCDGIDYTITVSEPYGSRISNLTYHGEPVNDDMELEMAFTSYRANGGGDFDMIRSAPVVRTVNTDITELLAEEIRKAGNVDFTPVHNISVVR